ncbi:uncharacterized protein LOC123531472 [Mercenaria mercenaria]|uniref:uncharacterized protein LOC123531472 n=1 Tax=Mercenaria mercenaria TaxID=6596 RepID=UPI00234F44E1|nr:uncharacterized protein LOC123531472 [Mercenaria mercenaria]
MLKVLIFVVTLGTSRSGTINQIMPETVSVLGGSSRIQHLSPKVDMKEITNHENRTEEKQMTRHTSRKTAQALERRYLKRCRNSNTEECDHLLTDLVQAHAGTMKSFRNKVIRIDFRYCLDGFKVVHFDTKTQICCDGLFNKTSGHEECCKGEIIDNTQQFCCNEQVQNRTEFSKCCGTFTYDERTHTCCNGHLHSKLDGSSCCGSNVYNAETEICCYDRYKFNRSEGDACCGKSVYNTLTHTCCENNIQTAYGKKNRKGECCKDTSFHMDCYKCVNDTVLPVFNESLGICCDGRVRSKKYGNNTGCCGRRVMDNEKHDCLNKEITNKSITTQTALLNVSEETKADGNDDNNDDLSTMVESDIDNNQKSNSQIVVTIIPPASVGVSIVAVLGFICMCYKKKRCSGKPKLNNRAEYAPVQRDNNQPEASVLDTDRNMPYTRSIRINNDMTNIFIPENSRPAVDTINRFSAENSSPTVQISVDDDLPNETRTLLEKDIISNIAKSNKIPNENVLSNHFKDTFTQTSPEKESNRRTIFGKPFEHNFLLGMSNATAQMPNSDVKMTLPQSILRHNQVEVNCTSFDTLSPLRRKLGLNDDERIASPVAEYALTGYGLLPDYAVVIIPFIGSPADLKVRKFQSDEGLNTVVKSIDVPRQGKMNEDVDVFYILKDSFVYVYTKSFSGFYCTTCRHRPLRLRSFLFGSYKRFTNPLRHEVRVMIYIADELMKFADYRERMFTNESAEGRVLKKEMLLKLPVVLKEDDVIQFSITPTESHCTQWIHKLYPGDTNPIYDENQTVELYHIAEKCKNCNSCHLPEHDIPHAIEWFMTNAEGVIPNYTFQCIVDIDVQTRDGTTPNRIVIDELQLRQEDRYPIEESFNARNVQGLKEYLSGGLSPEKRNAILGSLQLKYSCTGSTVEEVFFKLQEKLTPKYLLEAVACVLKEKHMFEELDFLQHSGYLPLNLVSTDVQPVCDDRHHVDREATLVNQNATTLPESNANRFESEGPVRHEENENVAPSRPNKTLKENESPNLTTNTSDKTLMSGGVVRPELSRTLRVTSFSKSMSDITLTRAAPLPEVRGELSTRARDSKSKPESQSLPVQEHASMDDTDLKTCHIKKCTD